MITPLEAQILGMVNPDWQIFYSLHEETGVRLYSPYFMNCLFQRFKTEEEKDCIFGTIISLTQNGYIKRKMICNPTKYGNYEREDAFYSITFKGLWALWTYNKKSIPVKTIFSKTPDKIKNGFSKFKLFYSKLKTDDILCFGPIGLLLLFGIVMLAGHFFFGMN